MIYSISGSGLSACYSMDGTNKDKAYDVDGGIVFGAQSDYDNYSISNLFSVSGSGLSGSSFQAFDIYNGVIVQSRHAGYLCMIDLNTGDIINSGMAATVNHCNSFSFSRVFYAIGDEFPLSYATDGYKYIYINRVTRTGTTLIKTYKTDPSGDGGYLMSAVPSPDGRSLYTLGYTFDDYQSDRGGVNLVHVAKWDTTAETDNGDGTYIPELISETTMPFIMCIQGTQLHDGLLFASSGYPNTAQNIYMIDPDTAQIMHTISIPNTVETEGCAWVDDYLIIGQNPSTISYKKVTFAEA